MNILDETGVQDKRSSTRRRSSISQRVKRVFKESRFGPKGKIVVNSLVVGRSFNWKLAPLASCSLHTYRMRSKICALFILRFRPNVGHLYLAVS